MDERDVCERGLAHSRKIGWQDGIDHYTERMNAILAAEYEAWATGELSEISDEAMCYGSAKYRQRHPEVCSNARLSASAT